MSRLLRLRSAPTLYVNRDFRIDRERLIIRDVVAMQAGVEALGHGCQADIKTLHLMAQLGNAQQRGIRSRFGHPGVSENAAGKKIAVARNFRVEGEALRHDLYLLDSARISPVFARDPIEYIFDMAERYPSELGESAVIDGETVWTLADGREVPEHGDADVVDRDAQGRPLQALTPLPVIRPVKFWYCDLVSEGALTHEGLFGADVVAKMFDGTANAYAHEIFELVDRWRDEYHVPLEDVPRKVDQVMRKYLFARGYKEKEVMASTRKKQLEPLQDVLVEDAVPEAVAETPEAESAADALDTALATAEETRQRQEQTSDDAEEPDAALVELSARVEQLEALAAEQAEQITKLVKLNTLLAQNLDTLDRNIRRVEGDPVVTMSVPKARTNALEPLQFGAPTPPAARALEAKPQHVSDRIQAARIPRHVDDEALESLISSQRRTQQP